MYRILYSNCWEDAEVVNEALDIRPGGSCLSITSAGDNTLGILSHSPRFVLAVDTNPAQLACLDLRRAAIECLSYGDTLAFLGVFSFGKRLPVYRTLRASLSPFARHFWDQHTGDIERGIIHAGRTERHFRRFRNFILPLTMGRADQQRLLQDIPPAERTRLCEKVFGKPRYLYTMRSVFSRALVRQFRIASYSTFYRSGNGRLADIVMRRVRTAFMSPRAHGNPYITYIITGNFSNALPYYLQPDAFPRIKKHLGALRLYCGPIQGALSAYPSCRFNGFNLSDIFEYMSASDIRSCVEQCASAAAPGARFVYWNTLKNTDITVQARARMRSRDHLVQKLQAMNRSFFYGSLAIVEVER